MEAMAMETALDLKECPERSLVQDDVRGGLRHGGLHARYVPQGAEQRR
jgi:hypothetical protein